MIPNAHIPGNFRQSSGDGGNEVSHTSKCKSELEERYGGTPAGTITMVHDVDVGIPATEFRIDDNEADGPIRDNAQSHQQEDSGEKSGLIQGVW